MKTDAKGNRSGSEAAFLQQEADKARAAIGEALSDLGRNLKATADPHALTRDHPWMAVSAAAIAGFAAAVTLIPTKEQQALRGLAEIERARHAAPSPPPSCPPTSDNRSTAGGVLGTIAAEVLKIARPLITTLLSAGIARATSGVANGPVADGNGHADDEEIATPS